MEPCDENAICPFVSTSAAVASETDGEVFWQWNGGETHTAPLGEGYPRSDRGTCYASVSASGLPDEPLWERIFLECSDDQRWFALRGPLVDLRTTTVGTYALEGPEFSADYREPQLAEPASYYQCLSEMPAGFGEVRIEEAAGSDAPFPQVVTQDFRRVFTIDIQMNTSVVGRAADDDPCRTSLRVWGSVSFVVTASHYEPHPNEACPCAP